MRAMSYRLCHRCAEVDAGKKYGLITASYVTVYIHVKAGQRLPNGKEA